MVIESVCLSIHLREWGLADKVALTQTPRQHYSRGGSEKSNTKSVCAALYMHFPSDFTLLERFMEALRLLLGTKSLGTWWWWCKSMWSDVAEQSWREGKSQQREYQYVSGERGSRQLVLAVQDAMWNMLPHSWQRDVALYSQGLGLH